MKASVKLRNDDHHHKNPLLRIKLPISVLGLPFVSSFTAGDPPDLSLNLHSNFSNGPSLKLSYAPTTTPANNPISLSLKSGVGLFGSPNNSPLIISAHFNLFGSLNPTFLLRLKPQFGDFSLSKTAVSSSLPNPNPNPNPNPDLNVELPKANGGFPYTGVIPERTVVMRNFHNGEDGFFSGVGVKAKTVFPVAKCAAVKFRWGVNFPKDSGEKLQLPYLTVDKISIERVEEERSVQPKSGVGEMGGKVGDLEVLKGMCFWMRKEVEVLQRENDAIKESLEEMKLRSLKRNSLESKGRKVVPPLTPSVHESGDFESWRSKKNVVQENARQEPKKFSGYESSASDVGEELKRAIKAASSNGVIDWYLIVSQKEYAPTTTQKLRMVSLRADAYDTWSNRGSKKLALDSI